MEWRFEQLNPPGLIKITASGEFCSAEYGAMLDELLSLPYWQSGTPLLFDFSRLRYAKIDATELMAASEELVSRGAHFAFTPVAMVMGTEADLEMGRRFGAITDHRVLATPRRFLNEANALSWLKSASPAVIGFLESLPLAASISAAIAAS